ncbi:MAG TPA: hypothetical protein PLA50_04880 [Bacteroidia bacterium]|nr:hypothetical protein [Bacteroidia bacterium]
MVSPRHPVIPATGAAILACLLCQCETTPTRTVKSTRQSYSFDEGMWGAQASASNNSAQTRSKFAESGYTISESGSIVADKKLDFRDKKVKGFDGEFKAQQSRYGAMEAKTKAFHTPEYLKRQEYAGVTSAREGGMQAREGNSKKSPSRAAGQRFDKKAKNSTELATFGTGAYRESNSIFETKAARDAPAVANAPRATGISQQMGYRDNASLSMDDVKKMLNPTSYARSTRGAN